MKIQVKNVSKSFKEVEVLNNINLEFNNGKIYGLIGKNGSGKSVLLKMICGFYKPTTGSIEFDNHDIIKEGVFAPNTRALIENPSFLPDLTGYENLEVLANIQRKITKEDIEKTLKDVNLYEEKDKKYRTYSLGMKQKLGLAQVLMEDPELIILDEPFRGIEESTVDKIRKLLLELKKKNKIILIATHDKEDLEKLADIVYKFENNTIQIIDVKKAHK